MTKDYSITLTWFHECEKELRLCSEFFLKNPKRICTWDKYIKTNQKEDPCSNVSPLDFFNLQKSTTYKVVRNLGLG